MWLLVLFKNELGKVFFFLFLDTFIRVFLSTDTSKKSFSGNYFSCYAQNWNDGPPKEWAFKRWISYLAWI